MLTRKTFNSQNFGPANLLPHRLAS